MERPDHFGNHRGGSRGRVQGVRTPRPPEMVCGFLIQLLFCQKKKTMWFIDGLKYGKRRVHPVLKKILDPPLNQKHFPFNLNVRFKFSASFSSEWNRIVQNFQKRGQPREVYPNFPKSFSEVFFPFNFAPRISGIFFREMSVPNCSNC